MANIKISELNALTPPAAADQLPVVDVSAISTKKTTVGEVVGIINGDVEVATDGTATISELPVSKLQDGDARQLLQTDAAGTGVEWTDDVDLPGTLDVTGAATFDSTVSAAGLASLDGGIDVDGAFTVADTSGNVATSGTLGVTGQSTLASAAVSDLTSGRVVLAGTSGELEDNAKLTFNGTQLDVDGNVVITGDLTVEGASTILETETVKVEDKNIELGVVASPTDVTADGGGITLKGTTDKTINWIDATDAWTSSERFSVPLGTGAAPSLTFTGDPNTGLYSPGADQVAVATNGAGRLFIDASGNVGINETTPLYPLVVKSAGTCVQQYKRGTTVLGYIGEADQIITSGLTTDLAIKADGNLVFGAGSTNERLRITSAGLVGVGATDPNQSLEIYGSGTSTSQVAAITLRDGNSSSSRRWCISNGAGGNAADLFGKLVIGYGSTVSANPITGTAAVVIDSSGRVGIGTTNVDELLHVESDGATPKIKVESTLANSSPGFRVTNDARSYDIRIDGTNDNLQFYDATASEGRVAIDSSGRLLVGTTSAGSGGTLSVNGTTSVGGGGTGSQASMSTVGMQLTSSISTSATTIFTSVFQGLSGTGLGHLIVHGANNAGAGFLDVVVAVPNGAVTVLSSTTAYGSPAARTYTMSGAALQLSMASGTYSTNVRCTSMGYPF